MKKRADQRRLHLNGRQVRLHATAERFVPSRRGLADPLALEVVPDELVGIQLGRIARQEMQLHKRPTRLWTYCATTLAV